MTSSILNDIPDKDEKVKKKMNAIIAKKEKEMKETCDRLKKELSQLKTQEKSGNYFVEPEGDVNPIIGIAKPILSGLDEGISEMQKDAENHHKKGGGSVGELLKIQKGAHNLRKMLNNKQKELNNYLGGATSTSNVKTTTPQKTEGQDSSIVGDVSSKALEVGQATARHAVRYTGYFVNLYMDMLLDFFGVDAINEIPFDKLSPELNKKIVLVSALSTEIVENPATREAIKEIAKAVALSFSLIIDEIKPELIMITDKSIDTMDQVGEKLASGAVNTGFAMIAAAVAEIPWVGGVFDFWLAFGKGFNIFFNTYKTFVYRGAPVVESSAKMVANTQDSVVESKNRITSAIDNARDKIKNASSGVSDASASASSAATNAATNAATSANNAATNATTSAATNATTSAAKETKGGKRLRKTIKQFKSTVPRKKFNATRKK